MSLLEARNAFAAGPVILAPDGQQTTSGGRTMDRTPPPVSLAAALTSPRTPMEQKSSDPSMIRRR